MRSFLTKATAIPFFLLLLIKTSTAYQKHTPRLLFRRDIECYKGEVACGSGCMPSTASCCGTGYCDAGNYCDGDGCCEDGKTCYTPTTFISLGPESITRSSTSPPSQITDPASSSSIITTPAETTEPGDPLSTGAKAGIGVGVGVGGLAILVGIGFWVVLARKRRQRDNGDQPRPPYHPPHPYEAYKPPVVPPEVPGKTELDSAVVAPMKPVSDMGESTTRPMSDATLVSSVSPVSSDRTTSVPVGYEPVPFELDATPSPRFELGAFVDQTRKMN